MSFHRSQTPQSQHYGSFSRINRTIYPNYNAGQSNSQMDITSMKQGSPFVSNPHGHPAFNPIRPSNKNVGDGKGLGGKQPKPPDKPLMPYMRYSRKVSRLVWDSIKANNPDLKLWEIGKVIGQMWRDLSDEQKQEYVDEYEAEKAQYMDALKVYHNSPAYLSWAASKGKIDGEADAMDDSADKNSRRNKMMRDVSDQRIISTMQANEEEDDLEDHYSSKNIAASRYHRNHCLINEIFSDALVPDARTVINEPRMVVLKRQVQSLTMHQKKLESELQMIEERHVSKKARFHEGGVNFYSELNKLCENRPMISDEQFEQMVLRARDELTNRNNNSNNNNNINNNNVDNNDTKDGKEKEGGDDDCKKEEKKDVEEKVGEQNGGGEANDGLKELLGDGGDVGKEIDEEGVEEMNKKDGNDGKENGVDLEKEIACNEDEEDPKEEKITNKGDHDEVKGGDLEDGKKDSDVENEEDREEDKECEKDEDDDEDGDDDDDNDSDKEIEKIEDAEKTLEGSKEASTKEDVQEIPCDEAKDDDVCAEPLKPEETRE